MILGYRIEKSSSALAIKSLIQNACLEYQPEKIQFLTDGGSENVNHIVSNFINSPDIPIKHLIAQKDVVFSNSMIEAINKIIKHQFLHPKEITNGNQLISTFKNKCVANQRGPFNNSICLSALSIFMGKC